MGYYNPGEMGAKSRNSTRKKRGDQGVNRRRPNKQGKDEVSCLKLNNAVNSGRHTHILLPVGSNGRQSYLKPKVQASFSSAHEDGTWEGSKRSSFYEIEQRHPRHRRPRDQTLGVEPAAIIGKLLFLPIPARVGRLLEFEQQRHGRKFRRSIAVRPGVQHAGH